MWHSARAYLASLDFLLEVFHRDIHPEVAVKVDDDGVDATNGIKHAAQTVVVANLCGELLALKAQLLAHKLIAERLPVVLRIGHMMCVIVSSSATKLGGQLASLQLVQLLAQTIGKYHDFFAQACGRCGLSVGLGQHGHIFPLFSILQQLLQQLFYQRIVNLLQCLFNREGHAGVIDVLRGKTEVDKLFISLQTSYLVKFFFDKIFYGLHIVVCHLFDVFHTLCACLVKGSVYVA